MSPFNTFQMELTEQYKTLFQTPKYSVVASKTTPEELAEKMTKGLFEGYADKDGEGVKNTCKKLKIPYTYKAIKNYLM